VVSEKEVRKIALVSQEKGTTIYVTFGWIAVLRAIF
jgi:hypothetical protein